VHQQQLLLVEQQHHLMHLQYLQQQMLQQQMLQQQMLQQNQARSRWHNNTTIQEALNEKDFIPEAQDEKHSNEVCWEKNFNEQWGWNV